MMKNFLHLILLGLISCTPKSDPYELFHKKQFDASIPIISIDESTSLQKIEKRLNLPYTVSSAMFLIPYDFAQSKFSGSQATHLLPLHLFNRQSLDNAHIRYHKLLGFKVLVNKKITNRQGKELSEKTIRNIFHQNILNRGHNPKLADSPKDAFIRIYLKAGQPVQDAARLLGILADEFLQVLQAEQVSTTHWNERYPLRIFLEFSS
ncbi:hypothetical protein BKI52_07400 [marine bacterium AO1-C]|nr:hypothetical protein BKI52_07400 [marine bacterium AO1-C]